MTAVVARPERSSDGELMDRLAAGDLSALGSLYDRYAQQLRRFAVRVCDSRDEGEDLTHDAFVELARSASRYDGQHPVRSYLIGIAGKLALRRRRRIALGRRVLAELGSLLERADRRSPERIAAAGEQLDRYRHALGGLTELKRVVVVMADVEGLEGRFIAEALDIPVGTVWTRLHYARAELRGALHRKERP